MEPKTKYHASAPSSKSFWLQLQSSKIAWAPQPWFKKLSSSTIEWSVSLRAFSSYVFRLLYQIGIETVTLAVFNCVFHNVELSLNLACMMSASMFFSKLQSLDEPVDYKYASIKTSAMAGFLAMEPICGPVMRLHLRSSAVFGKLKSPSAIIIIR